MPSFVTRLEGTFNQIRLKCPSRIADNKVAWNLKDQLLHGVCKHIRDSISYLHSNPETTYSQLMVVARKVESETKDAKEKVRGRSSTATEVTDSSKELADQMTRLMATLTRAEQSTPPATTPKQSQAQGLWKRADGQDYLCLPQLPQWLDWSGSEHLCSQLFCCK